MTALRVHIKAQAWEHKARQGRRGEEDEVRLSTAGSKWRLHMFRLTAVVPSVCHYHVDRTAAQVNYHDNRLITPI